MLIQSFLDDAAGGLSKRSAVLIAAALLSPISSAFCQVATTPLADSAKVTTIGPVVVSATRSTTTLSHMPLHATVVTQADIRKTPAQTVDLIGERHAATRRHRCLVSERGV